MSFVAEIPDNKSVYEKSVFNVLSTCLNVKNVADPTKADRSCYLSEKYMKIAKDIYEFEIYDDDIWVVSFSRCGTTWTQEMVWLIANNLDYARAQKIQLAERFPFLELPTMMMSAVSSEVDANLEMIKNMPRPRFIKTHLPIPLLPKKLWSVKPKIFYVTRNPKDAAISYYHISKDHLDFTGTIEDFFECFLADLTLYSPFYPHILDFWEIRHEPYISFHTYEEMKTDLSTIVRNVCKFLNKSYSSDDIEKLLKHLSFDSMKQNSAVNMAHSVDGEIRKQVEDFIRKGETGAFKTVMSPEWIEKFDKWSEEHLKNSDFKFIC